jgi:RHS repeat-associated protein
MTVAPAISAPPARRRVSVGPDCGLRALPGKGGNTAAEQKRAYTPESDQVGTISKVLDSAASVANAYVYDAFGVSRSAAETFENPYRFAGKPLDADSGLYHFIARQYEAGLGRFVSRDSYGLAVSFAYVQASPPRRVDPFGLVDLSTEIDIDIPQPFPQIPLPYISFPKVPDPHDALPALLKCLAKFGVDKFFATLNIDTGQICSEIRTGCRAGARVFSGIGTSGYRTLVPVAQVEPATAASVFWCWLKEMVNLGRVPAPEDATKVTMFNDNVWEYWSCSKQYQDGPAVLWRMRVKSTIKVGKDQQTFLTFWTTIKTGACTGGRPETYFCACCTI